MVLRVRMVSIHEPRRQNADSAGLQHAMDPIDRALRVVEMLENFDGEHRVERLAAPVELVQIAADVGLLRGIDVETHIALGAHVRGIRRRLRADVEDDARIQAVELPAQLAIERQPIDRPDLQRRNARPERRAQRSKHA